MSATTGIQWTDATWNPVVGCTKVSQGCKLCYAKTLHDLRHKAYLDGKKVAPQYAQPFERVQLMQDRMNKPLSWRAPKRVFVNSVSDLFHNDVPNFFLDEVFAVMALADRHTFQALTKRAGRMRSYMTAPGLRERIAAAANRIMRESRTTRGFNDALASVFTWRSTDSIDPGPWANKLSGIADTHWPLPNVWLGVSVENQEAADERIPLMQQTPAAVRFLSCEPLLGALALDRFLVPADERAARRDAAYWRFTRQAKAPPPSIADPDSYLPPIDWVIVGGESGKGARPLELAWVEQILADCETNDVPAFVKQLGRWIVGESADFRTINTWWLKPDAPRGRSKFDPSHAIAFSLCDSHGGDMGEWPERFRVREFPRQAVPA